jgi:hypothetical protein
MTLTVDEKTVLKNIDENRVNDALFNDIKPYLEKITKKSNALKSKIVELIVDDLINDVALADALDEVGKVIEYHAQTLGIEKPKFRGDQVIPDVRRFTKLAFSVKLLKVLKIDDPVLCDKIINAEIERIWLDLRKLAVIQKPEHPQQAAQVNIPEELTTTLKGLLKQKRGAK